MRKIKRVLVANRGEIALRIIRTVKELGLDAVAVYEKPDSEAYFLRFADQAIMIGDGPRKDYLSIDRILWAARKSGADAIHPGYGFLAENAEFSAACQEAGIVFIGPPPEVIRDLGNKVVARDIMKKAAIPFIPGTDNLSHGEEGIREAILFGEQWGYPLMLKASSGGGGRGIRKVSNEGELGTNCLRLDRKLNLRSMTITSTSRNTLSLPATLRSRSWRIAMAISCISVPVTAPFSADIRNCWRSRRRTCLPR